jgi:hypothetical protein
MAWLGTQACGVTNGVARLSALGDTAECHRSMTWMRDVLSKDVLQFLSY